MISDYLGGLRILFVLHKPRVIDQLVERYIQISDTVMSVEGCDVWNGEGLYSTALALGKLMTVLWIGVI
jgi:hypothetical protein